MMHFLLQIFFKSLFFTDKMYFHIILTEKCNSQCRYCYEKSMEEFDNRLEEKFEFDFSAPAEICMNANEIKEFLKKDPDAKVIFMEESR